MTSGKVRTDGGGARMFQTGVPNVDLILGGGIHNGDILLIVGPAGSGKTTLTLQPAFHAAAQNLPVLYITTLSEPPFRLLKHIETFPFFDRSRIGKGVYLMSVYPMVKLSLERVTDALVPAVQEHSAALLIIDG